MSKIEKNWNKTVAAAVKKGPTPKGVIPSWIKRAAKSSLKELIRSVNSKWVCWSELEFTVGTGNQFIKNSILKATRLPRVEAIKLLTDYLATK